MAVAAVLPRVRSVVICDGASASPIEYGVFTLEGVRQHLEARLFPCRATLSVFLILSSPRKGKYAGKILLLDERTDKAVRYAKFVAAFEEDHQALPLYVELADCVFPGAGQYSFEIYFTAREAGEVLKGEHPFTVLQWEE